MAGDKMAAVEAVQGKTDEKLGDDDDDDIRRISEFINCHPTMKRLFQALENKITTINHKNNSKGGVDVADIINVRVGAGSNAGNENVNETVNENVNGNVNDDDNGDVDDDDDDHDDDDDAHYRWLLQNEIDFTVDDFIQQIGTVVTRYETKFLPFFSGAEEAREFHPIPEGLRACRDTLWASIRANYATHATHPAPSSTMTVSECVRYMDTMAQTLIVKTWKGNSISNRRRGQENVVTRERLDELERGLDAAYDTKDQVRNMLRIFPGSIHGWPFRGNTLVNDTRLVLFLPIILEAFIDDGRTIEETRKIIISSSYCIARQSIVNNLFTTDSLIENKSLYDARCATVLRQLTKMNLLRKEDVKRYALLNTLLRTTVHGSCPMVELRQRFDFLVQLDPYALITQSDPYEEVYLSGEITVYDLPLRECASFITNFEVVFETIIRSFPNMKGICSLFQTNFSDDSEERSSPFKAACDQIQARMDALVRAMVDDQIPLDELFILLRGSHDLLPTIFSQHNNNQLLSTTQNQPACDLQTYGRDTIMGVVENVLVRNKMDFRNDAIVLAMIDKSITLDGLFFLLRRSPNILSDILLQPNCNELSSSSSRNSSKIHPQKKRKT